MGDTISFSQLSLMLTQLGFQQVSTDEFTAFRNAQFDAILLLPREEAMPEVDPLHVAAARATVAGKGVASVGEFDRLLAQAAGRQAEQASSANGHRGHNKPRGAGLAAARQEGAGTPRKKTKGARTGFNMAASKPLVGAVKSP